MLRNFERRDQDAVRGVILRGMHDRWGDAYDPAANPDTDDLWGTYVTPGGEIVVVEVDGAIIATGTLVPDGSGGGRILRMSVDRDHRRQGVGRTVAAELIERARRRGFHSLRVMTDTPWPDAVAFYASCGFDLVSQTDEDTGFLMRLDSPLADRARPGLMFNHAPDGYACPFCRNIHSGESEMPLEMLHVYDEVFVKLNPRWWPNNPGGALVIPIEHHENVYDLPVHLGAALQEGIRDTALAMKAAFACDGVSTRQHNEPAGTQDVWHYHVHVFPRFHGDDLYRHHGSRASADEMREHADRLRRVWPTG